MDISVAGCKGSTHFKGVKEGTVIPCFSEVGPLQTRL